MNQFEEGIPIPPVQRGPKSRKYLWGRMKVGESVFYPGKSGRAALMAAQHYAWSRDGEVRAWLSAAGERILTEGWTMEQLITLPMPGRSVVIARKRFTGRIEGDGYRIWRAEDVPVSD